jgi:hypothetical protein
LTNSALFGYFVENQKKLPFAPKIAKTTMDVGMLATTDGLQVRLRPPGVVSRKQANHESEREEY